MPIDPISLGVLAWVGEKIASGVIKGNAKAKRREAAAHHAESLSRLESAQEEHKTQAIAALQASSELGMRRTKGARRILARIVRTAKQVRPREAFARREGWFGGRNEVALNRMVAGAKALDARIDNPEIAGAALLLAAGIETLEHSLPAAALHNAADLAAQTAMDQGADWVDAVFNFGHGVSDGLAGLSILLSGVSLYAATQEAGKIRAQARELLENAEKLETDAKRHAAITVRARHLDQALNDLSYPAFRQAWIAEQIARGPKQPKLAADHAAHVRAFERTSRHFWNALSVPVVDSQGRADTLAPLELAPA